MSWSSPATSTTGRCPMSTPCAWPTRPSRDSPSSRASVVVTSGNHDSAQRLGFGSRLIDAAGVFIRTDARTVGTPVLLEDEHGPVAFHGLPYLDPTAMMEPWALPGRSHEIVLTRGDAPGARRSRHPRPHPLGRAGPRLRRRRPAVGVRARHQRRRRQPGAHRRSSTTSTTSPSGTCTEPHPRGAHPLQRLPAGLLLRRGRPGQGQLAGRPRAARASAPRTSSRLRCPAGSPGSRGELETLLADPDSERPRARLGAGHPDRPAAPGPGDGAAAPTVRAHPRARLRPRRRGAGRAPGRQRRRSSRPRHRPRLRRRAARGAGHPAESDLLLEACDACCDDTDLDVLVGDG